MKIYESSEARYPLQPDVGRKDVITDQNNGLTVSLFLNILFLVSGVVLVKLVSLLSRFWSCVLYVIVACVYIYCCNCSTKRVHILIIKILSWAVDGYHTAVVKHALLLWTVVKVC